jgi:hypothetical protein
VAKRKLPPATEIVVCTPYHGLDVQSIIDLSINKQEVGSMARLLFRKVNKALGSPLAVIAD